MSAFVLGYGSLVADVAGGHRAVLTGARRAWTVAMDNTLDLPGYKFYLDADGVRPAVSVAFLDLVDDSTASVEGICRPVTDDDLAGLDRRERQYERVDVTDRVHSAPGRTWTYVGRADSRARATRAREDGTLRIARAYLHTVFAAYDRLGADARHRFDASTDPPGVPVIALTRVDLG